MTSITDSATTKEGWRIGLPGFVGRCLPDPLLLDFVGEFLRGSSLPDDDDEVLHRARLHPLGAAKGGKEFRDEAKKIVTSVTAGVPLDEDGYGSLMRLRMHWSLASVELGGIRLFAPRAQYWIEYASKQEIAALRKEGERVMQVDEETPQRFTFWGGPVTRKHAKYVDQQVRLW